MFAKVTVFRLFCYLIITLISLFVSVRLPGQSEEQYLILPEIILPVIDDTIIRQPDSFPDTSLDWQPVLPQFRREYYLSIAAPPLEIEVLRPKMKSVVFMDEVEWVSEIYNSESDRYNQQVLKKSFRGGVGLTIQDGISLEAEGELAGHELTLKLLTPKEGALFSTQELSWSLNRIVNTELTLGFKSENENYFLGGFSWSPKQIMPKSIDFYAQIYQWEEFTGLFGVFLDYSLGMGKSDWFARFGAHGMSHGVVGIFSFYGSVHLGVGWNKPKYGLSLSLAAKAFYKTANELLASPIVDVNWSFMDGWELFASATLKNVYGRAALNTLRYKAVTNAGEVLPQFSSYTAGVSGNLSDFMFVDARVSFKQGRMAFYNREQQVIDVSNDMRPGAELSIDIFLASIILGINGILETSVNDLPEHWMTEMEYSYKEFMFFAVVGSENLLIFDILGDIVNNNLYAGLGFGIQIGQSTLTISAYAPFDQDFSGFVIKTDWRFL